jgi:hypothetical protein
VAQHKGGELAAEMEAFGGKPAHPPK